MTSCKRFSSIRSSMVPDGPLAPVRSQQIRDCVGVRESDGILDSSPNSGQEKAWENLSSFDCAMRSIVDLERLLCASETLLERVHNSCSGFPKASKCSIFAETYHEASQKTMFAELSDQQLSCLAVKY